jgi:hypothetical protein
MQQNSKPCFLITIDTEGDNLWANPKRNTTHNAKYLFRFQELCEKYQLKPTYLTNYEMANSAVFQSLGKQIINDNTGEIGMHLHAWDMPPSFHLTENDLRYHPYLIEYPKKIMQEKIKIMTDCLENTFGVKMISHRAGRWSFNETYANLLIENGYKVDCSVTPHVSWKAVSGDPKQSGGSDFTHFPDCAYFIDPQNISKPGKSSFLEIPVTIKNNSAFVNLLSSIFHRPLIVRRAFNYVFPKLWLRPDGRNLKKMKFLVKNEKINNKKYVEFMLHSSEFMPGGSPRFRTELSIEKLYKILDELFCEASFHYKGCTLSEFYEIMKGQSFEQKG